MISKNNYGPTNGYGLTNPNALSDGDEKGRGENVNGQIGTITDINERIKLLSKNDYNYTNNYGLTNSDAISDGDEKGRGENVSGQIGTKTDIFGNSIAPGRVGLKAMNIYSDFFQYNVNNPNAVSDGDEKGRGENASGQIGTKTDIFGNSIAPGRLGLLSINVYDNGFQYSSTNPNALSDGDEKGRGDNSGYPLIGTKTDIFGNSIGPGRIDLLSKNKYSTIKAYPDF